VSQFSASLLQFDLIYIFIIFAVFVQKLSSTTKFEVCLWLRWFTNLIIVNLINLWLKLGFLDYISRYSSLFIIIYNDFIDCLRDKGRFNVYKRFPSEIDSLPSHTWQFPVQLRHCYNLPRCQRYQLWFR